MNRNKLFIEVIQHIPHDPSDRKELAEHADISPQTLYNWVNGDTFSPRFNNLYKVAGALGMVITVTKPKRKRGKPRLAAVA